jgi:hypothetical protein
MRETSELKDIIIELNDGEALQAADYVAKWMQEELKTRNLLPPELQGSVNDDQSADLLVQAFPDLSSALQQTRLNASETERGGIARNVLLLLAEEKECAPKVDEAIDQLAYKCDPLTMMAIGSLIVFVLSIKFDVSFDRKNGFRMHASKAATSKETIKKILSMGASPGAVAASGE